MARLIDADALKERKFVGVATWHAVEADSWQQGWNDAIDTIIEAVPTIDPVKHGRWKIEREPSGVRLMVCDCGYRFPAVLGLYHFKYCPNCGAKMDKEEDDETD